MFFWCKSETRELHSIRSLACIIEFWRISRVLLIFYLNEATDGASFMSFGRSFQALTVEGKKELENKLVCTLLC